MNTPVLIAGILASLAFFVHTFVGDKELFVIHPLRNNQPDNNKLEKWTMIRCGWHCLSFDLLMSSVLLLLIVFTDFILREKFLLLLFSIYYLGYGLVWFLLIAVSKQFRNNFFLLGQWILLLVLAGLVYWGFTIQ